MKIGVIKIGRIAYPQIKSLVDIYQERLQSFSKIQSIEAKDDNQALKLIKTFSCDHKLILLDERGLEWTSVEVAQAIQNWTDNPGVKSLWFVVAGPMGPSSQIKDLLSHRWSLSRATLTSDMAWLLVWEQLYRAYSIIKNFPYHHD